MGCNPECYTKGRKCVISTDGKCYIVYKKDIKIKNFKSLDEFLKGSKDKNKTYIQPRNVNRRKIAP